MMSSPEPNLCISSLAFRGKGREDNEREKGKIKSQEKSGGIVGNPAGDGDAVELLRDRPEVTAHFSSAARGAMETSNAMKWPVKTRRMGQLR